MCNAVFPQWAVAAAYNAVFPQRAVAAAYSVAFPQRAAVAAYNVVSPQQVVLQRQLLAAQQRVAASLLAAAAACERVWQLAAAQLLRGHIEARFVQLADVAEHQIALNGVDIALVGTHIFIECNYLFKIDFRLCEVHFSD